MSYTDPEKGGEWETRKISIIGAAKSLISQLSVGQDLTRVSLPAIFLHPFSALEVGGARVLNHCDLLVGVENKSEPVDRFLGVLRWHLSLTKKEKFEKKPYNPVLGEWVYCYTNVDGKRIGYVSEQVEHHPPVAAIFTDFSTPNLRMDGIFTSGINFNGNSVTMTNRGPLSVHMPEHSEVYVLSTLLPSMQIKNVILGTRRMPWDGEVTITCEASGLSAQLNYKEEGWYCTNTIDGTIMKDGLPIMSINGVVGETINLTDLTTKQTSVLLDHSQLKPNKISFPPTDMVDERNSLNVWKNVNTAIVNDDMPTADAEKRIIEEAQRARRRENNNLRPRYFRDALDAASDEQTSDAQTSEANPEASPSPHPTTDHKETHWIPVEDESKQLINKLTPS
eukprot:TRINITY_DN814_c0_g1_i1.p1 TRINITY_DN814_c0_g1~~TRINITY_DN814_c0_g1_i1.p1  ORF type:complete len:394 (+),score=100.97 TRINITY_DN814_c0_g1_i1:121-1302(+)